MSGYCVRLDQRESYDERILALCFCEDYEVILGFKHKGDTKENEHYHLVIKTQVKMKAFRARFVKIFDKGKGNGHMSIKPWDGADEAFSYMFHEGGKPVVNKNVTAANLEKYEKMNVEIQKIVKEAKGKASYLLEDEAVKALTKDADPITICNTILGLALRTGRYLPGDFLLKTMVDKVYFRLQGGDLFSENQVIESITRRVLRL
jgi:hypothetical protein